MGVQLKDWLVLAASPRRGNSEYAAGLLAAGLREAGLSVDTLSLREHTVAPCTACGLCDRLPGECSLDEKRSGRRDDAAAIFERLRAAHGLIVAAPVYFYGLPAPFKALVDRSQRYWKESTTDGGEPILPSVPLRPAYALLPAGRVRGERLFDGSLLSLRPFLYLLGFTLRDHLPLRGLDGADALAGRPDELAAVRAWVKRIVPDAERCS